ncbi:OLC1v1001888C3 [Oldenlandia corymbosa var. corymbosa]|uniref:OLC1v1001888C3 n=1 Tax=Oldenlandia corymbosa var. corymbosa TaxID=529605 RepID=A0AAV1D726_OLDCO|nr:OLC1v1001888C3 [Oldenlandia corymbosa var. corymbosa]
METSSDQSSTPGRDSSKAIFPHDPTGHTSTASTSSAPTSSYSTVVTITTTNNHSALAPSHVNIPPVQHPINIPSSPPQLNASSSNPLERCSNLEKELMQFLKESNEFASAKDADEAIGWLASNLVVGLGVFCGCTFFRVPGCSNTSFRYSLYSELMMFLAAALMFISVMVRVWRIQDTIQQQARAREKIKTKIINLKDDLNNQIQGDILKRVRIMEKTANGRDCSTFYSCAALVLFLMVAFLPLVYFIMSCPGNNFTTFVFLFFLFIFGENVSL